MVCLAIDDHARRPASASRSLTLVTPVTPVAVIDEACRLPGGIDSPQRLWEALLRSDDDVSLIAARRAELTAVLRDVADGDTAYQAAETYTMPTG
jgi:acyl transferase domain-containing protein